MRHSSWLAGTILGLLSAVASSCAIQPGTEVDEQNGASQQNDNPLISLPNKDACDPNEDTTAIVSLRQERFSIEDTPFAYSATPIDFDVLDSENRVIGSGYARYHADPADASSFSLSPQFYHWIMEYKQNAADNKKTPVAFRVTLLQDVEDAANKMEKGVLKWRAYKSCDSPISSTIAEQTDTSVTFSLRDCSRDSQGNPLKATAYINYGPRYDASFGWALVNSFAQYRDSSILKWSSTLNVSSAGAATGAYSQTSFSSEANKRLSSVGLRATALPDQTANDHNRRAFEDIWSTASFRCSGESYIDF